MGATSAIAFARDFGYSMPTMLDILATLVMIFVSPQDAAALAKTAPAYLTQETASAHLAAARVAAVATGTDPDLLLSIAWHESRYQATARTPEAGGKVSCGVMTPEPKHTCHTNTVGDGYMAGAQHLRGWVAACRGDKTCALTGFAGGWRLIRACKNGPVMARPGVDGCQTHRVFTSRASLIRWEREKALRSRGFS